MKILVIKGSPNKNDSSNLLADNFIKGATEPVTVSVKLMLHMLTFHHVWVV